MVFLDLSEDVIDEIHLSVVIIETLFVLEELFLFIKLCFIHAIVCELCEPAPMELLLSGEIANIRAGVDCL